MQRAPMMVETVPDTVDARLGPQYRAAAETLAAKAVADAAIFSRVVTCDTADASCVAAGTLNGKRLWIDRL